MKRLYTSVWILLLTCIQLYGQLSEFMIESYLYSPSVESDRTRSEALETIQRDLKTYSGTNSIHKTIRYKLYEESGELTQTESNLFYFDNYPIASGDDRFFLSLYDMALESIENSIPFISLILPFKDINDLYVQPTRTTGMPVGKNIAEYYYVIYAALAYGAKGITYWPGLENAWRFVDNIPEECQLKYADNVLAQLESLHKKLQRNSEILLSLNFASVYHASIAPTFNLKGANVQKIHTFSLWNNETKDSFVNDKFAGNIFTDTRIPFYTNNNIPGNLMISFLTNEAGQIYYWVFNKNLESSLSLRLNTWNSGKDILNDLTFSPGAAITLAPGEAKLFTSIITSAPIITEIENTIYSADHYEDGFHPLETSHAFAIGPETTSEDVIFQTDVTKTFSAKEITIKAMSAEAGSDLTFTSNVNMNILPEGSFPIDDKPWDGNNEWVESADVYVYPNPTNDGFVNLHIEFLEEEIEVRIYNMMGKLISKHNTSTNITPIFINDGSSGIYFVTFNKGDKAYNIKVVKR